MIPNSNDSLCRKVRRIVLSSDDEITSHKDLEKTLHTTLDRNSNVEAEFTEDESENGDKIRSFMHDYNSIPIIRSNLSKKKSATSSRPARTSAINAMQRLKYICKDENGSVISDGNETSISSPTNNKKRRKNFIVTTPDTILSTSSPVNVLNISVKPQSERRSERCSKLNHQSSLKRQEVSNGFQRSMSGIDVKISTSI